MGFYSTAASAVAPGAKAELCPAVQDLPLKNRVMGSRRSAATRARFQPSEPLETVSETTTTVTITVSGLACWLSNDPIGISGGLNQYVFCSNNPVNFRDPLGLCEDGSKKVRDYVKAAKRDRFTRRFWCDGGPYAWSCSVTRDTFKADHPISWMGTHLRGDEFGNRMAGYGLAKAYTPPGALIMCVGAEVATAAGTWREGYKLMDFVGSLKDNYIGILWAEMDVIPFVPSPMDPTD